MKPKGIRLIANLILWIGIVVCLLACILALLLANGNPLGLPTEYVPDFVDFIHIGFEIVVIIVVSIILHSIANKKEKRARIRACWAEADAVTDEDLEDAVAVAEIGEPEPEAIEETPGEEPVAVAEEAPQSRAQSIRTKIVEKTPLTQEQLAKAEKIAKVAIPVGIVCATMAVMASKLGTYRKNEIRRQSFFNWLG